MDSAYTAESSPESSPDSDPSGRTGDSIPSAAPSTPFNESSGDYTQRPWKRRRAASDAGSSTITTPLLSGTREGTTHIPPLPTHDISNVPNHLSSIGSTAQQILAAATEAWDRRFRYKAVFALLTYWEDDDLNVAPEVAALGTTLSQVYHYKVDIWKIPTKNPGWQITARLIQFLTDNDAKGNLVLFYYAGHAMPNPQSGGAPLWTSQVSRTLAAKVLRRFNC